MIYSATVSSSECIDGIDKQQFNNIEMIKTEI